MADQLISYNPGGLSPRVRGNRAADAQHRIDPRSIPARAGEPPAGRPAGPSRTVYPRACGGTRQNPKVISPEGGLSPRVRGNHRRPLYANVHHGSIPARAGEPPPPA